MNESLNKVILAFKFSKMGKSSNWIFLFLLIILMSCSQVESPQKDTFQTQLIAICVEDLETSLKWYAEKLDFEIEKDIEDYPDYGLKLAFMRLGELHLELIESKSSIISSTLLPNKESYIGGGFKLGLRLNDLQQKFDRLKEMPDVEFVVEIGDLPANDLPIKWPSQHFLIKDPDGNFIQFFDGGENQPATPWLFMLIVADLEKSISWYKQNLGFTHHQTVGNTGNKRAVLERNDYILELFEPLHVIKANELPADSLVRGYVKTAFAVENIYEISANFEEDSIEIIMPIEDSDFDWATKAMIVKDPEGNWTQLFEIK